MCDVPLDGKIDNRQEKRSLGIGREALTGNRYGGAVVLYLDEVKPPKVKKNAKKKQNNQ